MPFEFEYTVEKNAGAFYELARAQHAGARRIERDRSEGATPIWPALWFMVSIATSATQDKTLTAFGLICLVLASAYNVHKTYNRGEAILLLNKETDISMETAKKLQSGEISEPILWASRYTRAEARKQVTYKPFKDFYFKTCLAANAAIVTLGIGGAVLIPVVDNITHPVVAPRPK